MRTWYSIKAQSDAGGAEISIYDEIGVWGITARDFAKDFKALSGDKVTLLINSPGGSVVDAMTICNTIQFSGKTVTGRVMGIAGSAASLIAAACHRLEMPENTFQFLHDPLNVTIGDADDHRATADMLDKVGESLVAMYAKRSGMSTEAVQKLLKEDTLLTAQECLDLKLCDEVLPAISATAKFETGRLPRQVQAMFASAAPRLAQQPALPLAQRIKAAADAAGVGEFVALWAGEDNYESAAARIAEAREIKALGDVVGAAEDAAELIRASMPLADARKAMVTRLSARDEATSTASGRPDPAEKPEKPALSTYDVWDQINQRKVK